MTDTTEADQEALAVELDRPPRWQDDQGNTYYRASALGMCNRIFVALSHAYSPVSHPAWFMEVLQEGKDSEQAIIDMHVTEFTVPIVNQQADFHLQILPNIFIVGHIDGEYERTPGVTAGDFNWGLEIKKIREGQWSKFLRSGVEYLPFYPWQVSAYWFGRNWEQCTLVGGRYVDGQITEIHPHLLTAPPIPLAGLRRRIIELEVAINDSTHVQDTPCNIKQYPCPFYYLHDEDDATEPPTRPPDDIIAPLVTELNTLAPQLAAANKIIKDAGERAKALRAGIAAWLAAAGVEDRSPVRVSIGDKAYEIKASHVDRDGYTVDPTDYTIVNVVEIGEDGKKVTKPRSPRKAAASKADKASDKPKTDKAPRPTKSLLDPATKPVMATTTRLPARPNLTGKDLGD